MFVKSFEKEAAIVPSLKRLMSLKPSTGETLLRHKIEKLHKATGTPAHQLLPDSKVKNEIADSGKLVLQRLRRKHVP